MQSWHFSSFHKLLLWQQVRATETRARTGSCLTLFCIYTYMLAGKWWVIPLAGIHRIGQRVMTISKATFLHLQIHSLQLNVISGCMRHVRKRINLFWPLGCHWVTLREYIGGTQGNLLKTCGKWNKQWLMMKRWWWCPMFDSEERHYPTMCQV